MSTISIDIQQEEVPKVFIRGQDLMFVMELPCDVPKDYFWNSVFSPVETHVKTTLEAQIRKVDNAGVDGFIADLDVKWELDSNYTKIRIKNDIADDTALWPIGPAEFDVVFTRVTTVVGVGSYVTTRKIRSLPVRIEIADGVTT